MSHRRRNQGERNHFARLDESAVREMRRRRAVFRASLKRLAEEFRVSVATVSEICRGRTWRHVPDTYTQRRYWRDAPKGRRRSTEIVIRARSDTRSVR